MSYWDTSALVKLYASESDSAAFENYAADTPGPIIVSTIALCFILPSARLPSISFDATSGALDVKSKSSQMLADRSNLSLKPATIRSANLPRPSMTCRAINAKFWS